MREENKINYFLVMIYSFIFEELCRRIKLTLISTLWLNSPDEITM